MENNQENLEVTKKEQKPWMSGRQRRSYLKRVGILKAKRNLQFGKWSEIVANNIKDGNKRSSEYEDIVRNQIESQLLQKEQELRLICAGWGYDKEETDSYINNWMEKLKPWPNA